MSTSGYKWVQVGTSGYKWVPITGYMFGTILYGDLFFKAAMCNAVVYRLCTGDSSSPINEHSCLHWGASHLSIFDGYYIECMTTSLTPQKSYRRSHSKIFYYGDIALLKRIPSRSGDRRCRCNCSTRAEMIENVLILKTVSLNQMSLLLIVNLVKQYHLQREVVLT